MTNEEAIKALSLMEHVESIVATYEPGEIRNDTTVRELKEACRVAIAALRAKQAPAKLDRGRWEGCWWCEKSGGVLLEDYHALRPEKKRGCVPAVYCPNCGRPLTEGAWAELERRINDGKAD